MSELSGLRVSPAVASRPSLDVARDRLAVGGQVVQQPVGGQDVAPIGGNVPAPRALSAGLHPAVTSRPLNVPVPGGLPVRLHPAVASRPLAVGGQVVEQPGGGQDVAPIGGNVPVPRGLPVRLHIFADGAALDDIARLAADPLIKGFTTNPTLMRKAGVQDYARFAGELLALVPDRPVSFEVFSDDFGEMEQQAQEIASWGEQVFVKIPVTNTRGEFAGPLIARLGASGVKVNVTAVTTVEQVEAVTACLADRIESIVSVFAGRIADTGRDPVPIMAQALSVMRRRPAARLLWASPREVLNVLQAEAVGCHIITMTSDLLAKLPLIGKDLGACSLDTVRMFHRDARASGFSLPATAPMQGRA